MMDGEPCGDTGYLVVDGFARLTSAVVGVVDQRQTKVLHADAQGVANRDTGFGKTHRKAHNHACAAIQDHRYLRLKRAAVHRVLYFGLK